MFDKEVLPEGVQVTEEDLANTPPAVLHLLLSLIEKVAQQEKRIEQLEAKLDENSSNSNKPSSTDSPYKEKKSGKGKKGSRKGRKGHRQKLMVPTETHEVKPAPCSCGCQTFKNLVPYYTHQHIELPEIVMTVIHFILYKGECTACDTMSKAMCRPSFPPVLV